MNRAFDADQSPLAATEAHQAGPQQPPAEPDQRPAQSEQDPAGGITLSGRNRACARARVLAGMVLTSGIVIALSSGPDTSVSAPH